MQYKQNVLSAKSTSYSCGIWYLLTTFVKPVIYKASNMTSEELKMAGMDRLSAGQKFGVMSISPLYIRWIIAQWICISPYL